MLTRGRDGKVVTTSPKKMRRAHSSGHDGGGGAHRGRVLAVPSDHRDHPLLKHLKSMYQIKRGGSGKGLSAGVGKKADFFEQDAFKDKHHWKNRCNQYERAFVQARKENLVLRRALAALTRDAHVQEAFERELAEMHEELDKLATSERARKKSYMVHG